MRLLMIHAKHFEYEARQKALEGAESLSSENRSRSLSDLLVVFSTVEKADERGLDEVAEKAAAQVKGVAGRIGVNRVLVYPYAHLSEELAPPEVALSVLKKLEELLAKDGFEVYRAPFGWYKRFSIECIGHPLAEVSRRVLPGEEPAEKTLREYLVLTPDGREMPIEHLKMEELPRDFRILVEKEVLRKRGGGGEPRYIGYCRKFGFEWEAMSDLGHMRYGPEAALIHDLVSRYAWRCATSLGLPVLRIKGTNTFDLGYEPVKQHADLYGDRLYVIRTDNREFILRYAACHQQFAMVKDWSISYRHLPFGVFEVADSYRLEQPGELSLCFRLRRFYMPDFHIFCKDLEEAMEVSLKVHEKIYDEIRKLGRDYVSIYNVTRSFFERHKSFIRKLAELENKPVLIHFVPEGEYYWVINVEYNIIDILERPREIGTFQIDVGNAERFGIKYVNERGQEAFPVIIHTAILGSIERYIYAVLDTAAMDESEGRAPSLPLWLAPVQVRIIPFSKELGEHALKIASLLNEAGIRADVDDREESLSKRVRDAEVKWIPYIVVLGPREVEENVLSVRIRGERDISKMSIDELIGDIREKIDGFPRVEMPLPVRVSLRPGYR